MSHQEEGSRALITVVNPSVDHGWRTILQAQNQVVLYNPTSHALSIRPSVVHKDHLPDTSLCPYCNRPLPTDNLDREDAQDRASNYFQLLEVSNEASSRPSTPPGIEPRSPAGQSSTFAAETMAQGYFNTFFEEECKLGMGANGSVFLCQHVLDGNRLGRFAVKKIAVGESHAYLVDILREVRLLEALRHPNIITYHHSWLETTQFSSFGPRVPALFMLMQWAEGGSLDEFIDARLGRNHSFDMHQSGPSDPDVHQPEDIRSRSARIRAFRAQQQAHKQNISRPSRPSASLKAVHLLSAEEIKSLFHDVTSGLAFLHEKSILHLDLKPGNVLLTWDEGKLIPRAMLSDFGTSQDMLNSRTRSGNTGTLEYASPESLPSPQTGKLAQMDSKSDIWSLGMILHKLLFFHLPYIYASGGNGNSAVGESDKMRRLEREILEYSGFRSTQDLEVKFKTRRLSKNFLGLLESLLHIIPSVRPSSERVLMGIDEGKLDPLPEAASLAQTATSLIPVSLKGKVQSPMTPENVEPDTILPAPISRRSPSPIPSRPAEEGKAASTSQRSSPTLPPLLTKPERKLSEGEARHNYHNAAWVFSAPLPGGRALRVVFPKSIVVRTVKSVILAAKVLSLPSACHSDGTSYTLKTSFLMLLAISDTWFENWNITVGLGALHFVLLRLGYHPCSHL
ncbi:kinase-like protein [Thelephora terrestris]|uniref:non-specific serine/threonine protein kinase n=1 Tax=Thelephora terrestris TaxID=56493 RepID=A0A9P6HIG8_9AGAM|nr:kinase-like protein [Thelephora terrestris]